MRHMEVVWRAALATTLAGFSPISETFATERPTINSLFRQAVQQVEREFGHEISISPIIVSVQTSSVGKFGLSAIDMSVVRDVAGLKFVSADRRGATDVEWKEAISILTAIIAPEAAFDEKQRALAELQDARKKGCVLAKQISNSWIMASGNPQESDSWFAFQIGMKLNDKILERPPPLPSAPCNGR